MEFALLLPVLLLMLLLVLDFGRVYLGYINLQNMARIAANDAANNPTTWSDGAAKYRQQALNDAAAINCDQLQLGDPVFTDTNHDAVADGQPHHPDRGVLPRRHLVLEQRAQLGLRGGDLPHVRDPLANILNGNGSSSCAVGWFVRYITSGPVGSGQINEGEALGIQLIK